MEVRFKNITKNYGEFYAVKSLDLTIQKGALHFILGPSGCGKTTTLRMLAGLESVSSGSICFNNRDITKLSSSERGIGMVFQNYALWPHMTVKDNIEYGLKIKKLGAKEIASRLKNVLEMTQLDRFVDRLPGQLSGGQQQRVALARAIAVRPNVLLLDEPLSNLDTQLRLEMRENISRIHQETKITTVYVTHDQKEALSMGTCITIMYAGSEMQTGSPREIYSVPHSPFIAGFIGETNLVAGEYLGQDEHNQYQVKTVLGVLKTPKKWGDFKAGESVVLSIRPESIKLKLPGRPLPENESLNFFETKLGQRMFLGEYDQIDLLYGDSLHLNANIFNIGDYVLDLGATMSCFVKSKDITLLKPDQLSSRT